MRRALTHAILLLLIAAAAAAETPPAWTIAVTSRGGFTAQESLTTADASGALRIGSCRFAMTAVELRAIEKAVAKARPERWAEAYGRDQVCCDLATYDVAVTRRDASGRAATFHSSWTLKAPDDLAAVTRAVLQIVRPVCTQ